MICPYCEGVAKLREETLRQRDEALAEVARLRAELDRLTALSSGRQEALDALRWREAEASAELAKEGPG